MSTTPEILLLTGYSGAGKSTIAQCVCETRGGLRLAERDIARAIAREAGFSRSRAWAQTIGIEAAAAAIAERTIALIQETSAPFVVVDGAYDRRLPQTLTERLGAICLQVVVVETPRESRVARYAQRLGGLSLEAAALDLDVLDAIKDEAGMGELVNRAVLRVTNDRDLATACEQVGSLLAVAG